jgi:hypothetical protein
VGNARSRQSTESNPIPKARRLPSANFGKSGEIVWRVPALYIGGVFKPFAKAAPPIAGRALGALVVGMIGGKLASAAGRMFGLEL